MRLNFTYSNDTITSAYVEKLPYYPNKKEALQIFKNLQKKLSSLSNLRAYKPKIAVVYYSAMGWGGGYKLFLTDNSNFDINRPFSDEPRGKFTCKRKAFKINEKDLIN